MRGLNVYCCPSCGHYGFFQLSGNAVCPHCSIPMKPLPVPYQEFMELGYSERQVLISQHILHTDKTPDTSDKTSLQYASPPSSSTLETAAAVQTIPAPSQEDLQSDLDTLLIDAISSGRPAKKTSKQTAVSSLPDSDKPKVPKRRTRPKAKKSETLMVPEPNASSADEITSDSTEISEVEKLQKEIEKLRAENEKLEQTVSWMHDMIWDLTRRLHFSEHS